MCVHVSKKHPTERKKNFSSSHAHKMGVFGEYPEYDNTVPTFLSHSNQQQQYLFFRRYNSINKPMFQCSCECVEDVR